MHNSLIGVAVAVVLYCLFFLRIVKSGIRPGPSDPHGMADRVIRVVGGIILFLFMLAMAWVVTQGHHPSN